MKILQDYRHTASGQGLSPEILPRCEEPIEGFVIASCGMCNFGFKEIRGCNLTLKIEDKIYPVVGTKIREFGNPHSGEGFCNAVRVAYVSGNIKDDKFYSDSFILIESPE